MLVLLMRSSR